MNKQTRRRARVLAVLLCLALSACGKTDTPDVQNTASYTIELTDYAVITNVGAHDPFMYNKKTGQLETYFSDPLLTMDKESSFRHYVKENDHMVALTAGRSTYDIYRVDLDSFYWAQDRGTLHSGVYSSYLGAEDLFPELRRGHETSKVIMCALFKYSGGYVVLRPNGVFLLKGNRPTQETCLCEEDTVVQGTNAAFDGHTLYYLLESHELIATDVYSGERRVVQDDVGHFYLTDKGLLVAQITNEGAALLWCTADGDVCATLCDSIGTILGACDDYIFFTMDYTAVERIAWDGSGRVTLPPEGYFSSLGVLSDPPRLVFSSDGGVSLCDYDGLQVQEFPL